jgi:hypothetical protein
MDEGKQRNPAPLLYLHIFLASPGDVTEERKIAREVIERLPKDPLLRDQIAVDVVAWDGPGGAAMEASMTPQEAIKQGLRQPSECDIAVVILWSRMGTPLPTSWALKEDGSPYRSGTEWEYLDALRAAQKTGYPKILVYRRKGVPSLQLDDPEVEEKTRQWKAVTAFFGEFRNPDGSFKGAYNEYEGLDQLREKLEDHLRARVKERLGSPGPDPVLAELNALGEVILKLHYFKSIADLLHELYRDQEVRFLRSQTPQSLSMPSLKRAARSGETALRDIRNLDEPKLLSPGETKRIADNLGHLDGALAQLLAVAGAAQNPDMTQAQGAEDAIANFTYQLTTQRDAFNKLAEGSWKELRLGELGTTFTRVRDRVSTSYPSYMARVDEGYRALTGQPPLFVKCDLLAKEHELLEKTLKELSALQRQLEASFAPAMLRSSCSRIKGFMEGARGYWDSFLAAAAMTDAWAVALLSSGKIDWNEIDKCRDEIGVLLESPDESQRDAFLNKLREAQENIEPHFQAVDEALAGAFEEVKNRLGEALTAVPA